MRFRLTLGRPRRRRVGVEIARSPDGRLVIRIVAVVGTQTVWRYTDRLVGNEELATTLTAALRQVPRRPWQLRPPVTVALGPSLTQVKRLTGLPPLTNAVELTAMVRANAPRFFLRNGVPIATSIVRVDAPGQAWAAAAEQPAVAASEAACRVAGLSLRGVVPTVAVLRASSGAATVASDGAGVESLLWADGGRQFALTYAGSQLVDLRRTDWHIGRTSGIADTATKSGLEADDWAGAIGAALAPAPLSLAWPTARHDNRPLSRARQIAAVSVLAVAVISAALAPAASSVVAARRASHYMRMGAAQQGAAVATQDSLRRVTDALADVVGFVTARRSATFALAGVADVLPDSTAVTTYRIDTATGTLSVLAEHASDLVSQLEQDPCITAIQIVGPVTQEPSSSAPKARPLERATLRFRWRTAR